MSSSFQRALLKFVENSVCYKRNHAKDFNLKIKCLYPYEYMCYFYKNAYKT